jgi:hypothetical protein
MYLKKRSFLHVKELQDTSIRANVKICSSFITSLFLCALSADSLSVFFVRAKSASFLFSRACRWLEEEPRRAESF